MDDLVGDRLRLSLVSREKLHREKVDLGAMARAAFERLQRTQPERRVELVPPERLEATGDARLLEVVLENLVGNDWKFTARREHARIEMGVANGAYFVRDDGAGFDPAHAARLFTPFQRLHRASEFQGTGIGHRAADRASAWRRGVGRGSARQRRDHPLHASGIARVPLAENAPRPCGRGDVRQRAGARRSDARMRSQAGRRRSASDSR